MNLRRWMTWFVAAHFVALLLAPVLLVSAAESSLPACCRRAGMHHCSGRNLRGDGFHAQPCASFPRAAHAVLPHALAIADAVSLQREAVTSSVRCAVALRSLAGRQRRLDARGPPATVLA